jgi:hypothetical protein
MARLRILCEIPNHPFKPGDEVNASQVDEPMARCAMGWCEWITEPKPARKTPPAETTAAAGAPETAARRTTRPPARPKPAPAKPEPAKAAPKPAPAKAKPAKAEPNK